MTNHWRKPDIYPDYPKPDDLGPEPVGARVLVIAVAWLAFLLFIISLLKCS